MTSAILIRAFLVKIYIESLVFESNLFSKQVAMGDGKITLQCLGSCEANFDITELQKALKPEFFSKWFRKIQMAEIGEVSITNKK